jgi:hypothetical protein
MEQLVINTLTDRNYGWLTTERRQAIAHIARVIREDNGSGELTQAFGHSHTGVLTGMDPALNAAFRLPKQYRLDVARATDEEIVAAVAKLIAMYVNDLVFEQDDNGASTASPYDQFLAINNLPRQPMPDEPEKHYSRRLLQLIDARGNFIFIDPATAKPFQFHAQPFQFGEPELRGLRVFLSEPLGKRITYTKHGRHPARI